MSTEEDIDSGGKTDPMYNSVITRLLARDPIISPIRQQQEIPIDLSSHLSASNLEDDMVVVKSEPADAGHSEGPSYHYGDELDRSERSSIVPEEVWQCQFCPFVTFSYDTLHAHCILDHKQSLASTDKFQTLSRESIGYNITPESYQCDRDATSNNQCLTSNANSPAGGSSQLLRHLLQGPQEPSQSASTFLRSIVQNINNRGTNQEIERKSSSASMRLMSLNRGDIALNSDGNRTSGNDGVTSSGCLASLLTKVQQPIPRKKQRNNDAQQGVSLLSVTSSSLNKQQQQQNLLYPVTIDEKVRNDGDEGYGRKEGSEHSLGEEDSQITGIKWRRKTPSTSSLSSDQSHDATTQWLKHYLQPSGNESGTVLSERRAMTMPSSSRRQNVTGSLRVMQSRRCIVRDVATQCEKETKFVAGNSSETVVVGEAQEGQGTHGSLSCMHCGLIFDDEVIHSIHMGCHNHADPYVCNVCGRHCNNRYGFYTHIMRGHYVNS